MKLSDKARTLGARTTNGVPIRLEIASRVLAQFQSLHGSMSESDREEFAKRALAQADALLEEYVKDLKS